MRYDDNPVMRENIRMEKLGRKKEADELRDGFVAEALQAVRAGDDFCICKVACPYHGKCLECVLIHRGHQDHLPNCLKPVGGG